MVLSQIRNRAEKLIPFPELNLLKQRLCKKKTHTKHAEGQIQKALEQNSFLHNLIVFYDTRFCT